MFVTESFVKWRGTNRDEASGATCLRNSAVAFKDGTKRRGQFCSICNLAQTDGAYFTLNRTFCLIFLGHYTSLRIVTAVHKNLLKSCDRQIAAKGNENERQTRKRAAGKQATL